MLRKIIKSLVPSKGDVFYTLFEEASINTNEAAQNFLNILNCNDEANLQQLLSHSKTLKINSSLINKKVIEALNNMFITPLDRGDIQELSGLLHKLTKRIVKISTKLKIYNIDAKSDDCLIKNANTLLLITKTLVDALSGLKLADGNKVIIASEKINELEENGIEDFRFAINEIYSGKFNTLTILKLKEIYKNIDNAIELGVSASDLVLQVTVKTI